MCFSLSYSFVEDFFASRYFSMDAITGEVKIAAGASIDREVIGPSLNFNIQAADLCKLMNWDFRLLGYVFYKWVIRLFIADGNVTLGTANGKRSIVNFMVNIIDINDDPPRFEPVSTENCYFRSRNFQRMTLFFPAQYRVI